MGGDFNATTAEDSTDYWALGRAEAAEDLLKVEADRLRDPLAGLTEKDFLHERELVLRELAQHRDPGSDQVQLDWLIARTLPGSAYARTATSQSVRSITFDDVKAFVRDHYTPAHVILVVTGPLPAPSIERATTRIFDDLALGSGSATTLPVRPSPPVFDLATPTPRELETRTAPVEEPVLWLAWSVPGDHAKGAPRAIAAADFLEFMAFWSALGPNWERVSALASHAHRMDGVSLVVARVTLRDADDAPRILSAFRSSRRYWGGTGGVDLHAAGRRDALLLQNHLALEALEVPEIARFVRATGNPDYIDGWQKLVATELSTDSRPYVDRYLRHDRIVALLVLPGSDAPTAPRVSLEGLEQSPIDHHGPRPEPDLPPGDPARALAGAQLGVTRHRLSNGLEVVLARREGFRAVDARLVVRTDPGGPVEEAAAALALHASQGDREWLEKVVYQPGTVPRSCPSGTVREDRVRFASRVPSDQLEEALDRLACRPRWGSNLDGRELESARKAWAEALERRKETVRGLAARTLLAGLYPGHPYSAEPTPARLRALGPVDARAWLARNVNPRRAALIVAGDFEATPAMLEKLEGRFGSWKGGDGEAALAAPLAPLPSGRRVAIVDRPGWETAELLVGVRVPPRADRDEPAFRANMWRLDSGLNGRLRLAQPLTYGVSVGVLERLLGPSLLLRTVVARDRAAGTVAELLGALSVLPEPLDGPSLARARWQVALAVSTGFGTSGRNAARLEDLFVHGLPEDEWSTFAARTASLTSDRLTAEAGKLALGNEVVVLVGDAAAIGPALRARGLAPEVIANPPAPAAP